MPVVSQFSFTCRVSFLPLSLSLPFPLRVCCSWSPLPPFFPPPSHCRSAICLLLFHHAMFPIHSVLSYLLPCGPSIFSRPWRTSLHATCRCVSESFCVAFVSCVPTFPRSIGTGPSSSHHLVLNDLQFLHNSSNFLVPSGIPA